MGRLRGLRAERYQLDIRRAAKTTGLIAVLTLFCTTLYGLLLGVFPHPEGLAGAVLIGLIWGIRRILARPA